MTSSGQPITVRFTTPPLEPQSRFWKSEKRFRAFVGGLGSGKTWAGCVEVLRQPAASRGMVLAPTYDMLSIETQRTLLALCRKAGILREWKKSERIAVLADGKEIVFRTADDPDKLRGPNIGWFWLDEAAMMDAQVWPIMIGRLRQEPARAWATTTPRGMNWLRETFTGGADYEIIRARTAENTYLPPEFVETLRRSYTADFARQELEGEFVDLGASIFRREWFRVVEAAPAGLRWVRHWDLATSTKTSADYTAAARCALASDGTLYVADVIRGRWEWPDARRVIAQTARAESGVKVGVEKVAFQLGAIQELRRDPEMANVAIVEVRPDKDKLSRALPWAARAEDGYRSRTVERPDGVGGVALVAGAWIDEFLAEVVAFPQGAHDDMCDAVSGAVQMLAKGHEFVLEVADPAAYGARRTGREVRLIGGDEVPYVDGERVTWDEFNGA